MISSRKTRRSERHLKSSVKLPIGIEGFQEIRTEGFYYVDKTRMISELLNNRGKVNLFIRPRRFGKSLNMNMLKYFFSYGCDAALFDGLAISGEKELCEKYSGKLPGDLSHAEGRGSPDVQRRPGRPVLHHRLRSHAFSANSSPPKKRNSTHSLSGSIPANSTCSICQKTS